MTQPPNPLPQIEHPSIFGPVYITGREIYDLLMHLSGQVSSIQQQLTQRTVDDKERDERVDARFQDHENRIRAQEGAKWPVQSILGLTSVAGVVIGVFAIIYH